MATQWNSTVMEKLTPILGYRHSMIHAVGRDDFPAMTPEQWRVGVNPAMAAASLLRGFADGQLRVWHFRKGNVPNVLMEAFSALLRELPADKQLFQRLDPDMLSRKFSSDLGL